MAVLGGLEFDGKGADQPGQQAAGADPGEVPADIVGLVVVGWKRACHRRRLHDADHGDHQRQRHQLRQFPDIGQDRHREARQRHRQRTDHADAAGVQVEQGHGQARADQADQRAGDPVADPGRDDRHDQDADTQRQRVRIGVSESAEDMDEAHQHMPRCLGHAQQGRQLADDDVDGDAGEEARGDGNREQGGEPTGPQQADGDKDDPDHNGQQRGQIGIMGGADGGDRRQPAGEDRRDGRVRRDRHEAVGTEGGEGERAGGKGIEPGLGRHAREPRGRELPGDRDRRQHQPGDQVARQPFDLIALQR